MSDTVDIEIENDEEEMADDIDAESVDPGVAADMEDEEDAEEPFEGERAVDFGSATRTLTETFDIDARKGETITDLSTVESEEGRQLVATVEHSRRTALAARLASAKRTGRRLGTLALVLGIVALAASALRRSRKDDGLSVDADSDIAPDDDA